MNDKQRIKLLKMIIAAQAFGSVCLAVGAYLGMKEMDKALKHSDEHLVDANSYIKKIVEHADLSQEQLRRINEEFDLEKWDRSFA